MLSIGNYSIDSYAVLAPMAGITDLPFRQLCRHYGAGLVVAEMVTSDTRLWHTDKSRLRLADASEPEPRAVQIAGSDPIMMANAAREQVKLGAQIIDINMGCPAKKVCKRAAGSALLADEDLVSRILTAVVDAVDVPVTLKLRTGSSPDQRNGVTIARLAEQCGIQSLAVHGRTRACRFQGIAEYETIAKIVESVTIPVIANGDITSPQKAKDVLMSTGAAAIMIGRGAQGRPWIFREINHFIRTGELLPAPPPSEIIAVVTSHLEALHRHYGNLKGARIARKHIGWYLDNLPGSCDSFKAIFNGLQLPSEQLSAIRDYFKQQSEHYQERAA